MTVLRVALAQINPTVGDLDGNVALMIEAYDRAEAAGCDIVAFPELSITGYPPEDLVLKPGFVADNLEALAKLRRAHRALRGGRRLRRPGPRPLQRGRGVRRTARSSARTASACCRTTTVFDEARYFTPGDEPIRSSCT